MDGDDDTGSRSMAALAAFVVASLALGALASFDLDPFDSAELALVAVTRGLGHPPGQPLHTLLGWIVTRVPWSPLGALAWLSIAPCAVALALASRDANAAAPGAARVRILGAAGVTALGACMLPVVRDVCARVEVYALAAMLAAAAVLVAQRRTARGDFAAGVLAGLAAATNPVVAAQSAGALWIAARRGRVASVPRMGLGALIGLGVFAYAWWVRDRATATLVWGAPHDIASLVRMLGAADFRHNVSVSPGVLVVNAARFAWDLTRTGTLPFLGVGCLALMRATGDDGASRARGLVVAIVAATLVGVLMVAANVPYLARNPDYGGYLLVPVALASMGVTRWLSSARLPTLGAASAIAIVAFAHAGVTTRPSGATRALAMEVLRSAPPHATLVIASDHLLFPVLYLRSVEHLRDDVTVLNPGWASSRWAWEWAMARDESLRANLAPGLGGAARLASALDGDPARVVLSEWPELLLSARAQPVCPHGLLWTRGEACRDAPHTIARTLGLLAEQSGRARSGAWDRAITEFTAQSLGRAALGLACPRLALRYYAAGLGLVLGGHALAPACDGERSVPLPPEGLLAIEPETLYREFEHVADDVSRTQHGPHADPRSR